MDSNDLSRDNPTLDEVEPNLLVGQGRDDFPDDFPLIRDSAEQSHGSGCVQVDVPVAGVLGNTGAGEAGAAGFAGHDTSFLAALNQVVGAAVSNLRREDGGHHAVDALDSPLEGGRGRGVFRLD